MPNLDQGSQVSSPCGRSAGSLEMDLVGGALGEEDFKPFLETDNRA